LAHICQYIAQFYHLFLIFAHILSTLFGVIEGLMEAQVEVDALIMKRGSRGIAKALFPAHLSREKPSVRCSHIIGDRVPGLDFAKVQLECNKNCLSALNQLE
jgi:hypothetical protein